MTQAAGHAKKMQTIKILSWNINGLKKNWDTLLQLMALELPEIVCIQNYRAHNYDHPYTIDLGLPKDENIPDGELWVCNYSRITANLRTSNGVAVFTRWAFAQSYNPSGKFDENNRPVPDTGWVYHKHARFFGTGRVAVFEFQYFTLVTVLAPAHSQKSNSLKRFLKREQFDGDLRRFLFDLKSVTQVVVTGDFKVAAEDVDADPFFKIHYGKPNTVTYLYKNKPNSWWDKWIMKESFPLPPPEPWIPLQIDPELRRRFKGYLMDGFYDALRLFDTRSQLFTCWPLSRPKPSEPDRLTKRQLNIGWRTDYFLLSPALKDWARNSTVLINVMGSRNAPIKLVLDLPDPDNPPPVPPPEPEVPNQPVFDWDHTYTEGDPSNPYFVPPGE
jgi:exonuclease III